MPHAAPAIVETLKHAILRHARARGDEDGLVGTAVPGLHMFRAAAPSGPMRSLYKPLVCLVLGGAKEVVAWGAAHGFVAGQSVVVAADVPVVGRVVRASPEEPYLAVSVELDMGVVRDIAPAIAEAGCGTGPDEPAGRGAVFPEDTGAAVLDCALRLVGLLDRPAAIPVLRATILRELHYWLLAGRHGAAIRRLALPGSGTERVARAVAVLRRDFARPVAVERLAAAAGMSASSFHRHFKAVTSVSPLQFQKHLRLLEARRLMTSEGAPAGRAAHAVGYESVPQFTREYGRMFGAPPRRDARGGGAARPSSPGIGGAPSHAA